MNKTYDPAQIEEAAQTYWTENQCFVVKEDLSKEKFYCLSMLPYPSGELHMGHVRNYTLGDVIARYQMLQKRNVLQPMGWDAFGLPAENAAIERSLNPHEWTQKNIKKMRKTFDELGFSYDWTREITTCEPEYYRWEQWLFVKLFKKGLAYKKNATVNWDPVDKTVLANEQVVNGTGWRSGAPIERRDISQWFLRITDYAEELLNGLDELKGWPEQVVHMQRNWIGRSEGTLIKFPLDKKRGIIEVFTTRPDTLMGVTYLAIAPTHPFAEGLIQRHKKIATFIKKCQKLRVAEADVAKQEKMGIDTGMYALHPITQKKLPIWITNFVVMEYGTGAVMSVPAHDERDHEFATKSNLPIQPVIEAPEGWDYRSKPYTEMGKLMHSGEFDGLLSQNAFTVINDYLQAHHIGHPQMTYRLRDWGISRQRYWGTPIPIIYCKQCGTIPVPEDQLPVLLPLDIIPKGHGSPLAEDSSFYKTKCPECGKSARRETDTMDTFVESSWYYARYCCPDQTHAMLDDRAKYWTPVDQYIGGIEHAVLHLLYARFMHKLLRDMGLLNSNEPFTRLLSQGMVLRHGAKMSKSKGNVISPQSLVKKYGADTVRLFITFAAPPEQDLEWSDSGVEGAFRFLKKVWSLSQSIKDPIRVLNQHRQRNHIHNLTSEQQSLRRTIHEHLQQAVHDMERQQFNTVVSACMKIFNTLSKIPTDDHVSILHEGLSILLRLLSPITPHICHCLWAELEFGDNILEAGWPKVDMKALHSSSIEMIVQINGKLRSRIQVPTEATHEVIEKIVLGQEAVQKFISDKPIKKVIVVPKKLINIVC